jgi:hypothetical protein
MLPHDSEAAWQLTDAGWLYVVGARAGEPVGGAVVTLLVGDLDATIAEIAARGMTCRSLEALGDAGRRPRSPIPTAA